MSTPRAEELHNLFRGTNEFIKITIWFSVFIEVLLSITSGIFIIYPDMKNLLGPFILLIFVVISVVLRTYGDSKKSFAIKYRKLSKKSFAFDKDIGADTLTDANADVPPLTMWLAKRLPAQNLQEYYTPTNPPGEIRLLEMYANSAFFTWRLLNVYGWIMLGFSFITLLLSVYFFYYLATLTTNSEDVTVKLQFVDILCSVVIGQITIKTIKTCISAFSASHSSRQIESSFFRKPLPTGDELQNLVDQYEIERALSPEWPTLIYSMKRKSLDDLWNVRKQAIIENSKNQP